MARLPPIDVDDDRIPDGDLLRTSMPPTALDEDYRHLFTGSALNVHRTVGHNPAILETFRSTNAAVYDACGLTKREREVVILTVAAETGSRYEWHQHVRHALAAGFTPAELRALADGDVGPFSDDEAALHHYAAAFVRGAVDDAIHEALAERVSRETLVGVAMLASLYTGLSKLLAALDVETEDPFVGWDLERL